MTRTCTAIAVLACLAAGCAGPVAPVPVSPAPLPSPTLATSPAPSTSPGPTVKPAPFASAPPPLSDPTQAGFYTAMTPQAPCPGQTVTIEGRNFGPVHHVTALWGANGAWAPYTPVPGPVIGASNSVKVGEADLDAKHGFRITFTLPARLGPNDRGNQIVLEPGGSYGLTFLLDGQPGGPGMGFSLSASPCPGFSPPPSLEAHLEPAAPCVGTPTRILGAGFTGPTAKLRFARLATRFNDGPRIERDAPVTADGRVEFAFKPEELVMPDGQTLFSGDGRYDVAVFDPPTSRATHLPIPFCNAPLSDALAATGIVPLAAMQGIVERRESPAPAAASEALVLRSQADLDAWFARHQLGPDAAAKLPAVDFNQAEVLLLAEEPGDRPAGSIEITAVEAAAGGYRVHAVRWAIDPAFPFFLFDFVVVPRTDGPVTFLPAASGYLADRPFNRSRQPRLDVSQGFPPRITP